VPPGEDIVDSMAMVGSWRREGWERVLGMIGV